MTNPNTAPSADSAARVLEAAKRLLEHADFKLGGALSADSKQHDIPSNAVSQVKARHLASLRDAVAAQTGGEAVAPEAKPEWPKGAFFTDGEGSFYDEQAEPLPGKESRHMDDSELYCPQCNGSGEGREMTTGHGPDDYEYDCPCQLCGGNGSLFRAFEGMKAERDALRQKYNAALARFPVPSLPRDEVEQRTYKDGTQATGTAPLPDKSSAEHDAALSAQAAPADYPPLPTNADLGFLADDIREEPVTWSLICDLVRKAIAADRTQRSGVSADPLPDLDVDLPDRVIDQLMHDAGVSLMEPWSEQEMYDFANTVKREVLARVPSKMLATSPQHQVKKGEPS